MYSFNSRNDADRFNNMAGKTARHTSVSHGDGSQSIYNGPLTGWQTSRPANASSSVPSRSFSKNRSSASSPEAAGFHSAPCSNGGSSSSDGEGLVLLVTGVVWLIVAFFYALSCLVLLQRVWIDLRVVTLLVKRTLRVAAIGAALSLGFFFPSIQQPSCQLGPVSIAGLIILVFGVVTLAAGLIQGWLSGRFPGRTRGNGYGLATLVTAWLGGTPRHAWTVAQDVAVITVFAVLALCVPAESRWTVTACGAVVLAALATTWYYQCSHAAPGKP